MTESWTFLLILNLSLLKTLMIHSITSLQRQTFEPPRDKTNKMACAPSEDSDQPGHPPRVFAVHMKKARVLSYPLSAQQLIRLGGWLGWSESSLGGRTYHFVCFVMRQLIFHFLLSNFRLHQWILVNLYARNKTLPLHQHRRETDYVVCLFPRQHY